MREEGRWTGRQPSTLGGSSQQLREQVGQGQAGERSQTHHSWPDQDLKPCNREPGAHASHAGSWPYGPMGFLCIMSIQEARGPEHTLHSPSHQAEHFLITGKSCCPLCQLTAPPGSSPWNSTPHQGALPPPLAPRPTTPSSLAFYTENRSWPRQREASSRARLPPSSSPPPP